MPLPSRLEALTRPLGMIWFSICLHWEAFKEAFRSDGLAALVQISQIRDAAAAKLLSITSSGFIAYEDTTIVPSLIQAATGNVLELGPGPGNQLHRFNAAQVNCIYGVEPNPKFQDRINAKLDEHGLRDKYKLIIAGIEDSDILRENGVTEGSLDAVLCIQVLCAVKDPKAVMKEIYKLLKPGGKFLFWEHGQSKDRLTAVSQAVLNPGWSTFVGCHLNRNVLADILSSGEWENQNEIEAPEELLSILPRTQGILIKKA